MSGVGTQRRQGLKYWHKTFFWSRTTTIGHNVREPRLATVVVRAVAGLMSVVVERRGSAAAGAAGGGGHDRK